MSRQRYTPEFKDEAVRQVVDCGPLGARSVIVGLLLIPILGASPLGMTGAIVGNVVFGLGIVGRGES